MTHQLANGGGPAHVLTMEERRRGGRNVWAKKRLDEQRLRREAVELIAGELLDSLRTYLQVRDDPEAPAQARIQAADRIVERILGRVGDRLELTGADGGPIELARAELDEARVVAALEEAGLVRARETSA